MRTFKLYYLIVCILSGPLFSQIVTNPFEIINEQYTIGEIYDTVFLLELMLSLLKKSIKIIPIL